jgi:hypothetical protein
MQCVICRPSAFSRLWLLQTRAPQQHNRAVLAFAEFKAKAAGGVGLTCRVVILVPAFGPATMGPCVATIVVPLASPLDRARRARILSGNFIGQPSTRGSSVGYCPGSMIDPTDPQTRFNLAPVWRVAPRGFDVLAEGVVVGRISTSPVAPKDAPLFWSLAYVHVANRRPTNGTAAMCEAIAAFAKSWRRD